MSVPQLARDDGAAPRPPGSSLPAIDDDVSQVFRLALREGRVDAQVVVCARGLAYPDAELLLLQMHQLRLLAPVPDAVGVYAPCSPELAEAELLSPLVAEVYATQRYVERTRNELRRLARDFDDGANHENREVLVVQAAQVPMITRQLADRCQEAYASAHLGGTTEAAFADDTLEAESEMAGRGVSVRTLLPHAARTKLSVQSYMNRLTVAGGDVRTVPQVWFRTATFDDAAAVVWVGGSDQLSCAVIVRAPAFVQRMRETFDSLWAVSGVESRGETEENVTDDLRRAVLGTLVKGSTDEVSARRLGMSLRTYRRHIARIMQELGAETRFQAGVLAHSHGLV